MFSRRITSKLVQSPSDVSLLIPSRACTSAVLSTRRSYASEGATVDFGQIVIVLFANVRGSVARAEAVHGGQCPLDARFAIII